MVSVSKQPTPPRLKVPTSLRSSSEQLTMSTTSGMKYTNLGQSGLRVSRICVGCMSYGDRRGRYTWCTEEQEALPILQYCYESGINFFDTANGYSNGVSEEILGKAIKKFNWRRENVVIATKVWAPVGFRNGDTWDDPLLLMSVDERERKGYINMFGLSRKHIFDSVDASLKRLDQEYIDLLQIHRFDPRTPVKETMEALHDVVKSGKVRYIGASSMLAHELLEMQYTARLHGWTEFISMQNLHNAVYREEEREMVPSLKKFGMGMIPWSPVIFQLSLLHVTYYKSPLTIHTFASRSPWVSSPVLTLRSPRRLGAAPSKAYSWATSCQRTTS